jgi:hypothetical protein
MSVLVSATRVKVTAEALEEIAQTSKPAVMLEPIRLVMVFLPFS